MILPMDEPDVPDTVRCPATAVRTERGVVVAMLACTLFLPHPRVSHNFAPLTMPAGGGLPTIPTTPTTPTTPGGSGSVDPLLSVGVNPNGGVTVGVNLPPILRIGLGL